MNIDGDPVALDQDRGGLGASMRPSMNIDGDLTGIVLAPAGSVCFNEAVDEHRRRLIRAVDFNSNTQALQ